MYERFSGQARKAMQLAHQEAQRLGHDCLGTGHLLLGVLREGAEGVAHLLSLSGLDTERVWREVEPHLSPGSSQGDWSQLPLTPAAKRTLEYARQEAARLHHECVAPEHLLLGLLREPDGEAAQLVLPLGLALEGLRDELAKRPAPENRDWLLRAPGTPGLGTVTDPTPTDLETVVTAEVVPEPVRTSAPLKRRLVPLRGKLALQYVRPSDMEFDLKIVQAQLLTLQFLVALLGGGILGGSLGGAAGAAIGVGVGCLVAALRSQVLGAFVGCVAGGFCARLYNEGIALASPLGGLLGLLLGFCLGDWREKRIPVHKHSPVLPPAPNDMKKAP